MALRLWMGPSGSGKTRFLFEYVLKEAAKHPDRNYLVIVPEQFTLSTQRELIRLSPDHGILNVDVLSFARLSYRIFEEVGFKNLKGADIDDMGKNLIIRHLAAKNEDKLSYLSGNMDKLGYVTEVKSAISEFMQYGISPDKVHELYLNAKSAGRGQLADKLYDVEVLYREFNKYTEDKYITKEEILSKASRAAASSKKIKKSVVIFDGFTGFTPVQYDLIGSLLQLAVDVHVTILTDTRDENTYNTEHELFYLGYKTAQKLKNLAELNNTKVDNDYEIKEPVPRRFLENPAAADSEKVTSRELVHLEKNLFRDYAVPYGGEADSGNFCDSGTENGDLITDATQLPTKVVNSGIRVFTALQPIDEVRKTAVEIEKLIREGGLKYKNIAIVTGDQETYIPLFKRVFAEYDIPFFLDKTQPVLLNPFIEYVRALADIITENFTYSAMFRYLRSPICGYCKADLDILENFVLKYGVKGVKNWNSCWLEKYSRYFKKHKDIEENSYDETLVMLENTRQKIMEKLSEAVNLITADNLKNVKKPTKSVNEINAVFMRVFEASEVEKRLETLSEQYSITDVTFENLHKKEYEKIYELVLKLMNRMEELLVDEKVSVKEYGELLDAGFDEIRIGSIPLISDYVQIGDVTRSRFENIHTLFIVGANDGIIPLTGNGGGIISDIEKEFLLNSDSDIELSPTIREKAYTDQLYLYMLMTKPNKQLVLSYSRLTGSGESAKPSYIVKVITDMFPHIRVEKDFDSDFDKVYNLRTGYDVAAEHIKEREYEGLLSLLANYNSDFLNDVRTSDDDSSDDSCFSTDGCCFDTEFGYENESDIRFRLYRIAEAAFLTGTLTGNDAISKAVAQVLYGKAIIGSVTRLEQYAKCSFSYFLRYGLTLKEREIFNFEAKDMGSVFHRVLEKYSYYIKKEHLSWTDISDEQMELLVRRAVEECLEEPEYAVLSSSSRHKYMTERITRISMRSVSILTEHLCAGRFTVKDAEISFSSVDNFDAFTFKLSDDEIMKLTGKIDRLDTYEDSENGRVYIKVIDYKSGEKSLNLVEVYRGISLQLVVYMNAAMELCGRMPEYAGKDMLPAGILYYHIDDPIVEGKRDESEEEIRRKIFKEFKMKGLVNSDGEVAHLMDSNIEKDEKSAVFKGSSDIIPVAFNKGGDLSSKSSAVSYEEFGVISDFVNKKIADLGSEILSGNIKAEPHTAKGGDPEGCKHCPYKDICKFDGYFDNAPEPVNKDNVLELMKSYGREDA